MARSHSIMTRFGYLATLSLYFDRATSSRKFALNSGALAASVKQSDPVSAFFHGVSPNNHPVDI